MENLDIIILSTIVSTLFIVFGIVMFKEFKNVSDQSKNVYETGPRANMVRFMGRLFEEPSLTVRQKKVMYKAMDRTIADMESEGIYFSEEVKEGLKKQKQELHCEYSGLPSVKSYQ